MLVAAKSILNIKIVSGSEIVLPINFTKSNLSYGIFFIAYFLWDLRDLFANKAMRNYYIEVISWEIISFYLIIY